MEEKEVFWVLERTYNGEVKFIDDKGEYECYYIGNALQFASKENAENYKANCNPILKEQYYPAQYEVITRKIG